jgi:hypothetical protein
VETTEWESVAGRLLEDMKRVPRGRERIAFILGRVSTLAPEIRGPVELLLFAMKDEMEVVSDETRTSWEKPAAVGFGIAFMVSLLVLAVVVPNPTPFQYEVFRIVLAIGVAGFAASISGLLHVQIGGWLQATGALAVFAIVYFYSPAKLIVDPSNATTSAPIPSKSP